MKRGGEGNQDLGGWGELALPTPQNQPPLPLRDSVRVEDVGSCRGRGQGRGLGHDTAFYRSLLDPSAKNDDRSPSWRLPAQAVLLVAPLFDCGAVTFGEERG